MVLPPAAPGFAGPFHSAVEVLAPVDLQASDPFVLLMDDRVEVPEETSVGGPHPHAGLETVTLVLDGVVLDRDEGRLSPGDALWMSAGRGVIHNESNSVIGNMRLLQLWIRLPESARGSTPRFELLRKADLPVRREPGAEVRLYSGATGSVRSSTLNHVPVTLAEFTLDAEATVEQQLPLSYNGFLLVLEGSVGVGDGAPLTPGQTGWLDRPSGVGDSVLALRAGASGARVLLYAGEPQNAPLVQYGPFVAGSQAEVVQLFKEFREGRFLRMSELTPAQHLH